MTYPGFCRPRWAGLMILTAAVGCAGADGDETPSPSEPAQGTPSATESPATPTEAPTGSPAPGIETLNGAAAPGDEPGASSLGMERPITALALWDGELAAATADGLFRLRDGALEAAPVFDGGEVGAPTGPILALTPRGEGLILAAEGGLYVTSGWALAPSPLSDALAGYGIADLAVSGEGAAEVLWLATDQGLLRAGADALLALSFPGVSGAPTRVAASAQRVIAAYPGGVVDLDPATLSFEVRALGVVADLAVDEAGVAWVATDAGALRSPQAGEWLRFTLSDEGAAPTTALALATGGGAYFAIPGGAVFIDGGADPRRVSAAAGGAAALAVDVIGDLWAALPGSLVAAHVGQPVSFAEAVSPIFGARCGACHLEGALAPKHDFRRYEEVEPMVDDLLSRVLSGQMPPDGPLTEDQYETITLWSSTGRAP